MFFATAMRPGKCIGNMSFYKTISTSFALHDISTMGEMMEYATRAELLLLLSVVPG